MIPELKKILFYHRSSAVFLIKNVAIPAVFLITLAFCLPFEKGITRAPWMFEWVPYERANNTFASSLIVTYTGLVLICTYILLDRTPIVIAPILALLTGLFASDYWELPQFVLIYLAHYPEQVAVGQRHALSFLWSPSLFHLCCGLIMLALLDFRWSKKKFFLFLLTPWVMYAINGLHLLNINQINLGPLGNITPVVATWLPNRIICGAVLVYIISDVRWRGVRSLLNSINWVLSRTIYKTRHTHAMG